MSGNVPPPPPPGPAPQDRDGDPSRSPARPAGSYQAPPSFAPGAPRATARSSTSAGSPSVPSAAERTMPHPVHQTSPQPAPTQHAPVQSPAGHQHAPIPPAPAGPAQAAAAQTQVHGQPPAPQVPHRQPSYSAPAPQYGYMSQPPAYQQQPAYQPPPAYQQQQQPAPQAPAEPQAVRSGPPTIQNPAVGARRRLSPGWIAFIVVDVVLIVVAGVFAFNALTGSAPQVPQDGETVAAAPSDGATDGAEGADDAAAVDPGEQLAEFASPSRNITCQIFENAVTCGIAALEQQPAPVESCDGTTGYVVTLDAEGMVSLPCVESGDTPKKAPKKMDQVGYGESVTEGDFTCESREDGMHCQHDPTGNGFSLARAGIGTSE